MDEHMPSATAIAAQVGEVDIDLTAPTVEVPSGEQRLPTVRVVEPAVDRITIEDVLLVIGRLPSQSLAHRWIKRTLDLVLALVLLIVTLPVVIVLWVIIRLDSSGPAIFRQTRVGRSGRLFTFYKFRTMYRDARQRFPEMYAYDYDEQQVQTMYFKVADDPRCTRVGRWLRRTSLDELPNLINVVKGEMSLVGPRPEIPEMLRHYDLDQLRKLTVKPGLTGLAQISGRNLITFQETIRRDLEYVEHSSLWVDLKILLRTPVTVIGMIGAL